MITQIALNDCPTILVDAVNKVIERSPIAQVIAVEKRESTPFIDKTQIVTSYKVFLQFGFEFAIYSASDLVGPVDSVRSIYINALDMEVIVDKGKWIGDDLRRFLNKKNEEGGL